MTRAQQHGFTSPLLLVCLLLLAQWSGFFLVLCVSGPGHVEVEGFNAACCTPRSSRSVGIIGGSGGSCIGCTDLPMQTASAWDPSRWQAVDGGLAVTGAVSPSDLAGTVVCEGAFVAGRRGLVSRHSFAAVPLRC